VYEVINPSSHNAIKTTAIKYSIAIILSFLVFPQRALSFLLFQCAVSLLMIKPSLYMAIFSIEIHK
jgi:hypothetical protein